jgi:hypothetical protein
VQHAELAGRQQRPELDDRRRTAVSDGLLLAGAGGWRAVVVFLHSRQHQSR